MDKEIKLVALDMDGTMLTTGEEVSNRTQKAIERAKENGVHVIISTGRWLGRCIHYAKMLHLNDYIITVNGGEIWTPDQELLHRHILDTDTLAKLWHLGRELEMRTWVVSTTESFSNSTRPDDFHAYEWLKIGFHSLDKEKLDKLKKELSTYEGLELTNSLPTNMEVNPAGVNKANGLKLVCRELGFTMENVMAVGDSLNDKKMIEQAGIGVAMGNAQQSIKDVADFVTDSNDQDGVAKAIEKFVLN